MLNIVLFGPPGAGKGTQSEKLIAKYNLIHLSTGDILRAERKAGTPLGTKANQYIEKGELVPDEVVIGMIENKLKEYSSHNGFIFDGFPRTVPQAQALDTLLSKMNTGISCMVSLDVERNELIKRLLIRGKDSGRADDQDENVIKNRIEVYNKETLPVADYYKKQNKLATINGIGSIDDIFVAITKAVDSYK
ncbi:MAG: adenylate kinase [Cytophagales bacterium]|nr:adenylate kinase [Cytophagales bacterium]